MKTSTNIQEIAKALLLAQKQIGAAEKDGSNPFFHSSYSTLGSVMKACKDALNKNGITVLQPVGSDELGVYVETVLLHDSGEFIADRMRLAVKADNDPQAQGSAITYARRYSLQSMVFIPAEDDDAEGATNHVRTPRAEEYTREPVETETKVCSAHDEPVVMPKRVSKSTGKVYWSHRNEEGQICFGSGYQA